MNKKTISLLLSILLMFSLAVPVAMADDGVCDVCGATDGHEKFCDTRCICDDSNHVPANEYDHVATCDLHKCIYCDAYINQQEAHLDSCHSFCSTLEEGTHKDTCSLYVCLECDQLSNQNGHMGTCSLYVCPDCGELSNQNGHTEGYICYFRDIYEKYHDNYAAAYYIAFVDKSLTDITFFSDSVSTNIVNAISEESSVITTVPSADCPNYMLSYAQFINENGDVVYHQLESFDNSFNTNTLKSYRYAENKNFSSVVSPIGLYATVASTGTAKLYNDPYTAGYTEVEDLSTIAGEYVVSGFEFLFSPLNGDTSCCYFKLTPSGNWPSDEYVWISADHVVNLSVTPTQQPTEPDEPEEPQGPTHSEGCGDECTVEGCTCVCHNDLLKYFSTATNLEELDDMVLATTEEEWNTFPAEAWLWLEELYASRPTSYKIFGATVYDPPMEGEICYPTVDFTNAAGLRPPVSGQ